MSEENMNNDSSNNQGQQEPVTAPSVVDKQQKSNKKIVVVISTIITLIVIAIIVAFVVRSTLTSEAAKKLEASINAKLELFKKDIESSNGSLVYTPFKCSGSSTIKCQSSSLELKDPDIELIGKGIEFTIDAGIKEAVFTTKGEFDITVIDFRDNRKGPFKTKLDCKDNAEIVGDKSYIINKISCNNMLNDITNKQESTIYIKNENFSVGDFISLMKKFEENNELYKEIISNLDYAVLDSVNHISSSDLVKSSVDLFNAFDGKEEYTVEKLRTEFNEAKAQFEMLAEMVGSDDEIKMIVELLKTVDNVLNKGHNNVDISLKLKEDSDIDDVFFLGFSERLYDITFSSK